MVKINPLIVEILVKKISDGEINPSTHQAFTLNDIIIEEYKTEVTNVITNKCNQITQSSTQVSTQSPLRWT